MGRSGHVLLVLGLALSGCRPSADDHPAARADVAAGFEAGSPSDEVRHARHFSLSRRNGYTVVRTYGEIAAFQAEGDEVQRVEDVVVLVPRGARPRQLPGDLAGAYIVEVPLRTLAVNNDDLLALVSA